MDDSRNKVKTQGNGNGQQDTLQKNSSEITLDMQDPLLGVELAERYRIIELIGSGGWGNVYKGKHLTLGTDVAIKVIHKHLSQDENSLKRLEQEAKLLSRLDSPSIVRIVDYGLQPVPYIVMEYFDGIPLSKWLKNNGPLDCGQAVELFMQMCDGLSAAEALGLVHRDLKPANVVLKLNDDGQLRSKILDFGIAKLIDQSVDADHLTSTGEVLGSPPYMSPEQWAGNTDHRSDIYSLACIMYEAISGKQAFSAQYGTDYVHKHLNDVAQPFNEFAADLKISPELEGVIRKCLQKSPSNRYQTAAEVHKDLEQLKAGKKFKIHIRERSRKKIRLDARGWIVIASSLSLIAGALFLEREPILKACCDNLNARADSTFSTGKPDESMDKYREVIALSAYLPNQDRRKLHAMRMLCALLRERRLWIEAEPLDKQIQTLIGATETIPEFTALLQQGLPGSQTPAQLLDQSEKSWLRAQQLARSRVGEHSVAYSDSCQTLGKIMTLMEKKPEAVSYQRDSLKIAEDLLEPDDMYLAHKVNDLGLALLADQKPGEAQKLFARYQEIQLKNANGPLPWNESLTSRGGGGGGHFRRDGRRDFGPGQGPPGFGRGRHGRHHRPHDQDRGFRDDQDRRDMGRQDSNQDDRDFQIDWGQRRGRGSQERSAASGEAKK